MFRVKKDVIRISCTLAVFLLISWVMLAIGSIGLINELHPSAQQVKKEFNNLNPHIVIFDTLEEAIESETVTFVTEEMEEPISLNYYFAAKENVIVSLCHNGESTPMSVEKVKNYEGEEIFSCSGVATQLGKYVLAFDYKGYIFYSPVQLVEDK